MFSRARHKAFAADLILCPSAAAAAAALLLFHICPNVFSLHVATRSVSKGADWRENEECVFKCKGTVRKERRGDLEGFGKTRFHAFLAVKDKFEVNRWKSRKIYFRRFVILRCINGGKMTCEVLYIPDNTQGYIPPQEGFFNCGYLFQLCIHFE